MRTLISPTNRRTIIRPYRGKLIQTGGGSVYVLGLVQDNHYVLLADEHGEDEAYAVTFEDFLHQLHTYN